MSSSDKCIGKDCRGVVSYSQQLKDLISGPNPDILKASTMLMPCPVCKSLASTPKEKIVTVLAHFDIDTAPKKHGYDVIIDPETSKNVRYKFADDESRHYGWQYRCGTVDPKWYPECRIPRCVGVCKLDRESFFGKLYAAARAPEKSPEADLSAIFAMCDHCGGGHPQLCGKLQVNKTRESMIQSIMCACKIPGCRGEDDSCTMYHGEAEKKRVHARLRAHVAKIENEVAQSIKWGANEAPLKLVSPAAAPRTELSSGSEASASTWPVLVNAPRPTAITAPPALAAPVTQKVVYKSLADDDSVSVLEQQKRHIASLRDRSLRKKNNIATCKAEIVTLNRQIETLRTQIANDEVDMTDTDALIQFLTAKPPRPVSSDSSSEKKTAEPVTEKKVVSDSSERKSDTEKKTTSDSSQKKTTSDSSQKKTTAASKKKSKTSETVSSPHLLPVLADSASTAPLPEAHPVVDASEAPVEPAAADLAGHFVILPAISPSVDA